MGLFIFASWHLSGCFLEIASLDFSEFWHGTRNPSEVVHNNSISWKNSFCSKNWGNGPKMAQKWPKIGFFEFNKKFHCIYSILKIFICYVPGQILWEKYCSRDIGQNPLSQSDCGISQWAISPKQIDETLSFLACSYGQSGRWTLKLN